VAVLTAGGGLVAVVFVHLFSWVLESALGVWVVHARLACFPKSFLAWQRLAPFVLGLAGVSAAVSASTWLRLAPLALYPYVAAISDNTGQFGLAWNAAMVIATAVLTVMNAAIPVLSRAQARADEKDTYYLSFCIRYGILFGSAAAIVGLGLGAWLIAAVAGESYALAGSLFSAVLWVTGPIVAWHALDQVLFLRGHTRFCVSFNSAALVLLLAAFALALRSHGPLVAVITAAIVMSIFVIAKIVFLRTLTGIDLLSAGLKVAACAVAGMASALALTAQMPFIASVVGLFVLVGGAFLAGSICPQEGSQERKMIQRRENAESE
jgi:O-antigen/teichoic acid export membrane protein